MIIEIVVAGLILMLTWWLFKSGLIWLLLCILVLGVMFLLFLFNASADGVLLGI
jgi:hypothetical protein